MALPPRKPYTPKPHPYDALRDSLKAVDNNLFGVKLYTVTLNGVEVTGTWGGSAPIEAWKLGKIGFPGRRHVRILYDSGHTVYVPDESDEEVARLATVFMDLLNSQYQE